MTRPLPCCLVASQTFTRPKMDFNKASQAPSVGLKPSTWSPKHSKMDTKRLPPRP